jgi:AraC-like DNA-binding protein
LKAFDTPVPRRGTSPIVDKALCFSISTVLAAEKNFQFRRVTPGIERLPSSFSLPRHRHLHAYATVVLAGSFEESGYAGRICAKAGDVLIHPNLDCHANQMISAGVKLIRLAWHDSSEIGGLYRLNDVDEVARASEKNVDGAAVLLKCLINKEHRPSPGIRNDWPDLLLASLVTDVSTEIGEWAERNGLARETVSRGFTLAYGVTPHVLRAEWRARSAWLRVRRGSDGLSQIATETGFADQPHMTRWIRRVTGAPPSAWRSEFFRSSDGLKASVPEVSPRH